MCTFVRHPKRDSFIDMPQRIFPIESTSFVEWLNKPETVCLCVCVNAILAEMYTRKCVGKSCANDTQKIDCIYFVVHVQWGNSKTSGIIQKAVRMHRRKKRQSGCWINWKIRIHSTKRTKTEHTHTHTQTKKLTGIFFCFPPENIYTKY